MIIKQFIEELRKRDFESDENDKWIKFYRKGIRIEIKRNISVSWHTDEVKFFCKTETGGYSIPKQWRCTYLNKIQKILPDMLDFIDNYKIPEKRIELIQERDFEDSSEFRIEIDRYNKKKWIFVNQQYAWRVAKIAARSGTKISDKFLNIPDADIWYMMESSPGWTCHIITNGEKWMSVAKRNNEYYVTRTCNVVPNKMDQKLIKVAIEEWRKDNQCG